ncbi:MAG: fimbria major subunit, partial [Muribaculaceae bacterium]|nr:fimbria major subunit [Muribaculaceae bacterium]
NIPLGEADMDVFGMSKDRFMRILVVANAGNLTKLVEGGVSVRGIADYTAYGNAWTVGGDGIQANSDYFVMSSAFNGVKRSDRYSRDGLIIPGDRIYTSEVSLERVAARIDLEVAENQLVDFNYGGENVGKGLKYDIKEADHYLTITDIVPVNLMQQNSYLLKQVTEGTDLGENMNAVSRFVAGDEKTDAAGLPTNYVISPSFLSIFNNPAINNATYFGDTSSANLRANYKAVIESGKYRIDRFGGLLNIPTDSWGNTNANKALLVTYSNENTVHERFQVSEGGENGGANGWKASDYITGLLFRAQYHPAKVYTTGRIGEGAPSQPYTDGEDFWLFRTVEGETKESKNLYFASEAALNAYVATLPAGGEYETQYYPGGICYYNIWVKHANIDREPNETEQNFPMKYGIVRNNIYRISLSFNGIGEPKPEIREPYNVMTRIFVVKWNFRPQPEIIM